MQCPRCQHENSSRAKFCEECATPLARICTNCSTPLSPTAKFCSECAHPVAAGPGGSRFASPESYTPKHLAAKILTSRSALEGERKQVTVLFADLKGSMELLADRDPEEARKLLDPVLSLMMDGVHHYEGTVNQVMGDGIMALFGAPLAHEDHAVRACYAALRIQESVRRYAEEAQRAQGTPVHVRVGLNSGEVVVRSIGSDLRMDYTAVGQTTHLAARMEQMATPRSVLLTDASLRLAEGSVEVKSLGLVPIKGLDEPVAVYELTGVTLPRTRFQAAAARGLTRFAGRDIEMAQLGHALDQAENRHGQVVAVVGEPGVGKSRLFWELTHSHRTRDWLILESSSVSYGTASAYLPLIDLLKAYFQIEPRDDRRRVEEKVTTKLLALDRLLEPLRPALLGLLDLRVEDAQWQALDPAQRRQQILEGVKRLLLRESQVQPLLVVLEDLHWVDSETQAMLDVLVESLPAARLLLLVNYRPEYRHSWTNRTYYRQLRVDPLPPASAETLLHSLMGENAALSPLKRLLLERTEGNPFFLEESVRILVETGTLVGEQGAYRLKTSIEDIQMPATVQAVLAARIDRLPLEDKRLLQAAAVIGKDVPFALLEAIADLSESDLRGFLTRLQATEFLYETQLFPDLQYTFKHALTHEVAYGSLLQERRQFLHRRVVTAIEDLYGNRLEEQIESLAHHALQGELWEKAAGYLRQVGAKARPRAAYREARACFEQAVRALERLPETRDTVALAIDLRLDLAGSLFPLGERATILDQLHECKLLAESLDDRRRLGRVLAYMIEPLWDIGDNTRAVEVGERALHVSEEVGDFFAEGATVHSLARVYYTRGAHRRAIELQRRNVASLEGDLRFEYFGYPLLLSVAARGYLVASLAEVGEFSEGMTIGKEALGIAEAVGHPLNLVSAHLHLGLLHLQNGEAETAIAALERSLDIVQRWSISIWFHLVASPLGLAYALAGHFSKALRLLEEAVEDAAARGKVERQSLRLARLGEGYLLAGRMDQAITAAQLAADFSLKYEERGNQAWALRLLGEVAAHRDPPRVEDAQDYYGEALALATNLAMRPLGAHCHLGLGKLSRRAGKRAQAHEHLTTALTMYREMGMSYWLEKAETEMKECT